MGQCSGINKDIGDGAGKTPWNVGVEGSDKKFPGSQSETQALTPLLLWTLLLWLNCVPHPLKKGICWRPTTQDLKVWPYLEIGSLKWILIPSVCCPYKKEIWTRKQMPTREDIVKRHRRKSATYNSRKEAWNKSFPHSSQGANPLTSWSQPHSVQSCEIRNSYCLSRPPSRWYFVMAALAN